MAEGCSERRLACSVEEAAYLVGLSRAYLYVLIGDGQIETIKIGRRRLVLLESLTRLLGRPDSAIGRPTQSQKPSSDHRGPGAQQRASPITRRRR